MYWSIGAEAWDSPRFRGIPPNRGFVTDILCTEDVWAWLWLASGVTRIYEGLIL